MSRLKAVCALLILLLVAPGAVLADGTGAYLVNLLRNADFSEDKDRDGRPDWWLQVHDPDNGFKAYGVARLDKDESGSPVTRLVANGTDVALQGHSQALVRVDPSSSYHLKVDIQNQDCAPRDVSSGIGILWLDADKQLIHEDWRYERHEGPESTRPPSWLPLVLNASDVPEKAAWARVRFGLFHGPDGLSGVSVKGTGWFRGLSLTRRPRIDLIPEHEERIFPNQDSHEILFDVEGLERGQYHCHWAVQNYVGEQVASGNYAISNVRGDREHERNVDIDLGRRKGWYELKMSLETRGDNRAVIARESMVFGVGPGLEELGNLHVSEQMGLDLQGTRLKDPPDVIGNLVEMTRARHVTLTLWNSEFDTRVPLAKTIPGELVGRMNEANVRITAVLGYIPPEVQGDFLGSTFFSLLSARRAHWEPLLTYTGQNYAEIDQWILGAETDTSMIEQGTLASPLARETRRIMGIPGLKLGLPVGQLLEEGTKSIYPRVFENMDIFTFVQKPGGIEPGDYLDQADFDARLLTAGETFQDRPRPDRHVRLELRDLSESIEQRLDSLVFGTLNLLDKGADRINIRLQPPNMGLVDRDNDFLPEMFAYRTLTEIVSPLRILGEIDLPSGSRNRILEFSDDRFGTRLAMVVWNKKEDVVEDIFLGSSLKSLDLMGNRDPLPVSRNANHIPVGRIPKFLIDLDEELMRTRLSVTLSRPVIDSRVQDVRESVEITNFLKEDLSGELDIVMPEGWSLLGSGKSRIRTMKTGERRIVGFRMRPESFETTGKDVKLTLNFTFDGNTRPPMTIFKRFQFKSRSILMNLRFPEPEDQKKDILPIHMSVRNIGGGQIDLIGYNATVGREEDERFLGLLKPGAARNETFQIRRSDILAGRVTIGVRENGGFGKFVNRRLAFVDGVLKDIE